MLAFKLYANIKFNPNYILYKLETFICFSLNKNLNKKNRTFNFNYSSYRYKKNAMSC